jgi:hypothetical protein
MHASTQQGGSVVEPWGIEAVAAVTSNTLCSPVQRLARCRSVADVTGVAIDRVRAAFGCHVGAVVLLDDATRSRLPAVFGVRDANLDEYERDWRSGDQGSLEKGRCDALVWVYTLRACLATVPGAVGGAGIRK